MLSTYNHYTQMMSSSFDNNVDRMLKKARTIEDKTEKKRKNLGRTAERHKLINESRFETFKVNSLRSILFRACSHRRTSALTSGKPT